MKIQMRDENFEHLTERNNDFQENNLSISNRNRFEMLMNNHIDLACDFRIDFVTYLLYVLRIDSNIDSSIDSNRDDQDRIYFERLNKNRFKYLNNDYDSDAFSIRI
jgi:hypothetical protein